MEKAFKEWRSKSMCNRIAESAFNKVLEINHEHSFARFNTASYILEKVVRLEERKTVERTFEVLYHFAKINTLQSTNFLFSNKENLGQLSSKSVS